MRFIFPKLSAWAIVWILISILSYLVSFFHPEFIQLFAFDTRQFLQSSLHLRFLSFSFVTDEFIILVCGIMSIFIFDKLVSTSWTSLQVLLFYVFMHISALLLSALCCRLNLINCIISGAGAIIAAVMVLAAQFDPDRFLVGWKYIGLTTRYGVSVVLGLMTLLTVLHLIRPASLALYISGFFTSWFYLRFLQWHPRRKSGDHRPAFALAKFFPQPLERWVAIPSNMLYRLALSSKLFPGIERQSEIISTASFATNIPGLTADSERHRKLALKVLNERLATSPKPASRNKAPSEWPSLVGDEDSHTTTSEAKQPGDLPVTITINPSGAVDAGQPNTESTLVTLPVGSTSEVPVSDIPSV